MNVQTIGSPEVEQWPSVTTAATAPNPPIRRLWGHRPVHLMPETSEHYWNIRSEYSESPSAVTRFACGPDLQENVGQVIRDLIELRENYDGDWESPSDYAYWGVLHIAGAAYYILRQLHPCCDLPPAPLISTDTSGGVRMSWRSDGREVRMNVGAKPDLKSYIYFESRADNEHDIEACDEATLAQRLYWLIAG